MNVPERVGGVPYTDVSATLTHKNKLTGQVWTLEVWYPMGPLVKVEKTKRVWPDRLPPGTHKTTAQLLAEVMKGREAVTVWELERLVPQSTQCAIQRALRDNPDLFTTTTEKPQPVRFVNKAGVPNTTFMYKWVLKETDNVQQRVGV